MEHLIDKDALVAEIEKYISNYKGILNNVDKSSDDWVDSTLMLESKIDVLQHILSFIDTLEVKEVENSTDALIEKAKEAFCKATCNGHLGTCKEYVNFVKYMKGE